MAEIDVSEPAQLFVVFTLAATGATEDPTTVSLTTVSPTSSSTTYVYGSGGITRDSKGNYHADVTPGTAGWWRYYWIGTGVCAVVQQGEFLVLALPV